MRMRMRSEQKPTTRTQCPTLLTQQVERVLSWATGGGGERNVDDQVSATTQSCLYYRNVHEIVLENECFLVRLVT